MVWGINDSVRKYGHLPMAWGINDSVRKYFPPYWWFFFYRKESMQLTVGYSYHLKDSFFSYVDDDKMMSNKENGGYRPHFCAIQDKDDSNLFWMVPISSRFDKFKRIHDNIVRKQGKCDKIVLGRFAGKNCAFLIQNAFCTRNCYVAHVHKVQNNPVRIHNDLIREIQSKLYTCLALRSKGINLFYTDIDSIKQKM